MRVALRALSLISQLPEGCSDEDVLFVFAQIDGIMREGGYPKIGCVGTDAAHAETFIKISENFRERCPRELHNFYDAWETFVKNHREFTQERERWLTETNIKYQEWKQQQEAQAAKEQDGIRNS